METLVKEKPILFSTPMVQAILEGRKTQTRRIMKPQPALSSSGIFIHPIKTGYWTEAAYINDFCPYGCIGDEYNYNLWLRETWGEIGSDFVYKADYLPRRLPPMELIKWKPSIHMPRKVCRLLLEIQNIRIERLQNISEADSIAEGIEGLDYHFGTFYRDYESDSNDLNPIPSFQSLWQSINGADSWNANPWVWVLEFKRHDD